MILLFFAGVIRVLSVVHSAGVSRCSAHLTHRSPSARLLTGTLELHPRRARTRLAPNFLAADDAPNHRHVEEVGLGA